MDLHVLGKWLLCASVMLAAIGTVLYFLPKNLPLGRLPGDIIVKRDHFSFYFPLTTCIVLSLLISFILRLFR